MENSNITNVLRAIRQTRDAVGGLTAEHEPLIDLKAAAEYTDLTYYQLYRAVQNKRLQAFPAVGDLGQLTARYLVRLTDVKALTPARRGPKPKSVTY